MNWTNQYISRKRIAGPLFQRTKTVLNWGAKNMSGFHLINNNYSFCNVAKNTYFILLLPRITFLAFFTVFFLNAHDLHTRELVNIIFASISLHLFLSDSPDRSLIWFSHEKVWVDYMFVITTISINIYIDCTSTTNETNYLNTRVL